MSVLVQVQPECTRHDDCADTQICHQGSCQNACRFEHCGVNAVCTARDHVARCECLPGYRGENPNKGCRKREFVILHEHEHVLTIPLSTAPPTGASVASGCSSDSECPDYSACENKLCINPCAVRDPCAPLATCRVVNHEPICTCPDGFVGLPTTECRPRECMHELKVYRPAKYSWHSTLDSSIKNVFIDVETVLWMVQCCWQCLLRLTYVKNLSMP